eukprot:1908746-Prymnesium_polylepis.1
MPAIRMGPGRCCTAAASQVTRTEHTHLAHRSSAPEIRLPTCCAGLYAAHDWPGQVPANPFRHAITAVRHISLGGVSASLCVLTKDVRRKGGGPEEPTAGDEPGWCRHAVAV